MNDDEIWYKTLDKVIQWIQQYKTRPSYHSTDVTEKKIRWLDK